MKPEPKPGVLDITAYVGGRASAPGAAKVFKLSSNESPLGPTPAVAAALAEAATSLALYPEGSATLLRRAIAEVHHLDAARIVTSGDGSDALLTMLANAYLQPGDEVVFSEHAFLVYKIATQANSARPVMVPERTTNQAIKVDVDAMLAAITPKTRMVYLANPNNPTGSCLNREEMARLHAGLPPHVLLVIDAAYGEYVTAKDYESGLELARQFPNVVMTRTFSKLYGLAGLRIGWMYASAEVCDAINRIRGPFNTALIQQLAGAAAVRDREHFWKAVEHNNKWLPWVTAEIRKTGLRVDDSCANFVLIHFPAKGEKTAAEADAYLTTGGIILRSVASYGLPDCLRMTIGTEEQNRAAVALIQKFMAA
ncbi:MAG: histidinol-phosphate transaminase [Alphaproteobacteria bacterium]|nr:histidinol-phosphate transaminase [Alphaproteobacteria bacterium]